ncbi:DEAD/DEAH box helicase family protein [Traorella massiliensis]|uniref:DEAD/DEAH box helicase family protein n=1 Tax=Traorella massiliensis TaxID=1903263 RepID=UPI0023552E03|nr:DEAD/DEAH box helicase family protein [Traorella massiliensis]
MFYKMIENKCKEWYSSTQCTVNPIIDYIEKTGQMRDAQIEAIKIYLFLKIGCECKPLEFLFRNGVFNSINLNDVELSTNTRKFLEDNPAATALFEYSRLTNDKGEQVSEKLEKQIKKDPSSIDYDRFFRNVFYGLSYTDYLFSLPMGAGKTYLMAAFIYLDLYFAKNEPLNPAFAHNFIIFAPSGLKSSVVPSLKTIQNFDPAWIIPEPSATEIKRSMSFEVLDQSKTANKSNKTKNPNVQKIANHQPLSELFGLVAVTNAEKVILDRIVEKNGLVSLFEDSDDEKDRQANELRNLIGKLPSLSIFIDEVHHAVSSEIKLRAVVTKWAQNNTLNSVIGFSGTPYLDKAEKFKVVDSLSVGTSEITNIVYYYPLIDGVGNFLKRPVVKIAEIADSALIIEKGVREFLDTYKDTVYDGGLVTKLGIYCGTIEKLEEVVYPLVSRIVSEYGLGTDVILKFHKGNKQYNMPADSQLQFDILDKSISKIRIILLVQIGKEGWDCKSLTGIILSQEGDCPTNMVLQTSCRCLRQVVKGAPETALIYLNESNAEKLNAQLEQQHHITLKEFSSADNRKIPLKRYDRTSYLKLPKVDFYQLKINYGSLVIEKANPKEGIIKAADSARYADTIIKTTDLSMDESKTTISVDDTEYGKELATFNSWVYGIMKGGFGSPTVPELMKYEKELRDIFASITYQKDESRYYSSKYNRKAVESNIRKAYFDKTDFTSTEELIPQEANLLNIKNFTSEIYTDSEKDYYPDQTIVENIIKDDKGKLKLDPKMEETISFLESNGNKEMADKLRAQSSSHINKDRSFHYLPYHTDSSFEQAFLKEVLSFDELVKLGLEVYYNGDRSMTEFKIKCYKNKGNKWNYVGFYTPDFLIIQRKNNDIHKVIIVETKGDIYANDPEFKDKRKFMETEFLKQNNKAFGYNRFEYLYLEDTMSESNRLNITFDKIRDFFRDGN